MLRTTSAAIVLSFIAPAVSWTAWAMTFPDVPSAHVYAEAIAYVQAEGLMTGQENGLFAPDQVLNRAEFITVLMRYRSSEAEASFCISGHQKEGTAFFPDIPMNAWYAGYVCSAKSTGIVKGYPDGTFRAESQITMAEAATLVARAWKLVSGQATSGNAWYQPSVSALRDIGAIPTSASTPKHLVTRGEFAFLLQQVLLSERATTLAAMPSGTKAAFDIAFGSDPEQKLDVFYDPSVSKAPVMLLVHGGKWVHGRKENMYDVAEYFRSLGYTVVTTDYRRAALDGNAYPIPVQDVACSLAWTKQHAAEFGGDPSKVVLFGFSGGAHMGALVSYHPEGDWLKNCSVQELTLAVAGYIGAGGAYDFDSVIEGHGDPMKLFLGDIYAVGKWEVAEPLNYVNADDPPALITVGDAEESLTTSTVFVDKLKAIGVPVTFKVFEGFAHTDFVEKLPTDSSLQEIVEDFLHDIVQL